MSRRSTLRASIAGVAMTLAAASAFAADAVQPAASADAASAPAASHHHKGHHGGKDHHKHAAMMWHEGLLIPGLGPIGKHQIQALKLTDAQQAQVKEARDAQRALFQARRDAMVKQHALLDQQVDAGKIDPRALAGAWDANRQQFSAQAGQVRDKWLAVWDGLNDTQRAQVTAFVKARKAKMQEAHQRHAGQAGHHAAAKPDSAASGSTPAKQ